jgi:hypothetical protein
MTKWFELVPSFGWLLFMVLPTIFSFQVGVKNIFQVQSFCILIIFYFILIADIFALKNKRIKFNRKFSFTCFLQTTNMFLLFCLVIFWIYKIYYNDKIPLFEAFRGVKGHELALLRNDFDSSTVSVWFSRLLNPLPFIIGSLMFGNFYLCKKYFKAFIIAPLTGVLLLLATSKSSLIIFLLALFLITCSRNSKRIIFFYAFVICIFLLPLKGFVTENYNLKQISNKETNEDLSDFHRHSLSNTKKTIFERSFYRIFLVPVCVSYRWYEFKIKIPKSEQKQLLQDSSSLANCIGLWAYYKRFPHLYLPFARAYASVDADAFVRFGFIGVFLAGICLSFLRIGLFLICAGNSPVFISLYSLGLSLLFCVPFQGSIQALLGPQGFLIVLVTGFILKKNELIEINKI